MGRRLDEVDIGFRQVVDEADRQGRRAQPVGMAHGLDVQVRLARIESEVEIDVTEPARVVAVITREAAEQLALEAGQDATALVKATSVMVER